jgi:hypothetical protein
MHTQLSNPYFYFKKEAKTSQKASTYFHEIRLRNAASCWNKIEDDGLVASVLSHLLPFLLDN